MELTWKDYLTAYIKVAGVFRATRYVWRPFGELLEVDRCVVDGELVTNSQSSLSRHTGHRMSQPVKITFFEMILIWTRVIN